MNRNSRLALNAILSLASFVFALASSNANAIFFFFPIPSFGAKGDTCIAEGKKAGDTFRSANGNVATIKSVAGTSSRCKQPGLPVLATVEYAMSTSFLPKAGISVPDGYSPQGLTDLQKFNGILLYAKDNTNDSNVVVISTKRDVISDTATYVEKLRADQANRLDDAQQSEIEKFAIDGMQAWRFETKGKLKTLFGTRYSYLTTVIEGEKEVVMVNAWTFTNNYEFRGKDELKSIALSITGIKGDLTQAANTPKHGSSVNATVDPPTMSVPANSTQATSSPSTTAPPTKSATLPESNENTATSDNAANRLRDLNKLYKEGVITQEEFDAKKKEILKSM